MKYTHILFDLDGTVTDPFEGISKSICYALGKFGIKVEDKNSLRSFIGPPLFDSFRNVYSMSNEESTRAVDYYREYYLGQGGIYDCRLCDGIEETLKKLSESDCKVILATSKPENMAKMLLEHFGLSKYFDHICGASLDESRAKKSDVIAYALKVAEISDKSSCIMIGDTKFDIIGAAENGLSAIGVTFGYGSLKELKTAGAILTFDDAFSLSEYLLG